MPAKHVSVLLMLPRSLRADLKVIAARREVTLRRVVEEVLVAFVAAEGPVQ